MHKAGGRVLVTGGAGYIGSVLVPMLLGKGKQVTLLDIREPSTKEHWTNYPDDHLRLVVGDIRSEEVIGESLRDVDSIIYLAGAKLTAVVTQTCYGSGSVSAFQNEDRTVANSR